jgi:hypothetical protein
LLADQNNGTHSSTRKEIKYVSFIGNKNLRRIGWVKADYPMSCCMETSEKSGWIYKLVV